MKIYEQLFAAIVLETPMKLGLFGMGMVAFAFVWVWGFNAVTRKQSGWSTIAVQFPMTEVHMVGESYKHRSGDVGNCNYERGFHVHLAQEGLCVYPFFARRIPCLIPWSSIRTVSVSNWGMVVVVDYETPFRIYLPAAALDWVRSYVPPERFKEAVSFFEAAGEALKSIKRPRWLWRRGK